ncbi:MAG TPA: amidohydrolase family protein [Tepidisphaeraceae bacterium]|jgi:hypothetical protein
MPALYDVHTHVGLDAGFYLKNWWPYASTALDLLNHLDQNQITHAVCFPFTLPSAFDPYAFARTGEIKLLEDRIPFDHENALLRHELDRVDQHHRLLQFAMFDPSRHPDEQARLIEPLVGKIKGLKAQTTVIQSPILALLDTGKALMHLARKHNLPVLFHTAVAPADSWAQARDCLTVAKAYPDIRFNLAHSLRFDEALLKEAAALPNVWVDCSAHLAHCQLARENSAAVAPRDRRLPADYTQPADVLTRIHALLKGKYLWGSDNPFMSWCSDNLRIIYTYEQEAQTLRALPTDIQQSLAHTAPEAWLFGL